MYLRCCSHSRIFLPAAGLIRSGRSAGGWLRRAAIRLSLQTAATALPLSLTPESGVCQAREIRSWTLHSSPSSRLAVIAATNSRPQTQWLTDWASRRTGAPVMRCHTSRLQWQCAPTPAGTITRTAHGWACTACRAHSSRTGRDGLALRDPTDAPCIGH